MPSLSTGPLFITKANKIHNNKYKYDKVIYINSCTKIIITCRIHGDFEQTPNSHLNGNGCKQCYNLRAGDYHKYTTEEFVAKVKLIHKDKYIYDKVSYVNNYTKILITCPIHGDFEQTPAHRLQGKGCRSCLESKGEKFIAATLDKYNITYIREYKIPDTNYKFRYDFYLPDHNLLIEFHGRQHYEPVDFFGGEEGFKQTKFRDDFKRALAKELNLNLIEFSYKELNPSNIGNFETVILTIINKLR